MKIIPNGVTKEVARHILKARKHSPRILFGAGVVGAVTSTVLACKATLSLTNTLDDIEHEVKSVKKDMSESDGYKRDLAFVYAKGAVDLGKLYAPSLIVGTVSIAALTGSHITLTRQNAGLTAAYAAVSRSYDEYRDRVRAQVGESTELDLYHATETVEVVGEDGKKSKISVADPNLGSPYAKFFDKDNMNYQHNQEYNKIFLQAQQNYANGLLQNRGHVFLNEIYTSLGFDHTRSGAIVGWVLNNGDDFIDFGIYDIRNADSLTFGENADLLLDFNVDGKVWDLI